MRIIRAGIYGFLNIRNGRAIFREELKQALCGKTVIPPELEDNERDFLREPDENLTNRDMELIDLILEEMDNKEIAEALNRGDSTVRNRRSDIYAKVNVKSTIGLLKYLFRRKVITFNDFVAS